MITGNLSAVEAYLGQLAQGLEDAAGGAGQSAVAEAMAERGKDLLKEEFASKTDPTGKPWVPPAHDYGHPLLDETGALKDSGSCDVGPQDDASGFQLTFAFTDEKAIWHQRGTKRGGVHPSGTRRKSSVDLPAERQHIPPRPMLPAEGQETRWREQLEAAGQVTLDQWLSEHVSV